MRGGTSRFAKTPGSPGRRRSPYGGRSLDVCRNPRIARPMPLPGDGRPLDIYLNPRIEPWRRLAPRCLAS
eukprot:3415217-Pyramimonas_sp.AAC.1